MGEKMATLRTLEDEMVTKVIMGDPIERFDQFVADWRVWAAMRSRPRSMPGNRLIHDGANKC